MIDISLPLGPDLIVWPGNPRVELIPLKRLSAGQDADVSELRMGTHAGTHLDPPSHMIPGGPTSESIDLDVLVGPALVVDLSAAETEIRVEHLATLVPHGTTRLLMRTRNSALWDSADSLFPSSYVALSTGAAEWLVRSSVQLVGIDFLSIEAPGASGRPVHRTLLAGGVAILEGVDLRAARPGPYRLVCLPLRLVGADGAPARAVLFPSAERE